METNGSSGGRKRCGCDAAQDILCSLHRLEEDLCVGRPDDDDSDLDDAPTVDMRFDFGGCGDDDKTLVEADFKLEQRRFERG